MTYDNDAMETISTYNRHVVCSLHGFSLYIAANEK